MQHGLVLWSQGCRLVRDMEGVDEMSGPNRHMLIAGYIMASFALAESEMRNVVALGNCSESAIDAYNDGGAGIRLPKEFVDKRAELCELGFSKLADELFTLFPYTDTHGCRNIVDRVISKRNLFAHPIVRPCSPYWLSIPHKSTLKRLDRSHVCDGCGNRPSVCSCPDIVHGVIRLDIDRECDDTTKALCLLDSRILIPIAKKEGFRYDGFLDCSDQGMPTVVYLST